MITEILNSWKLLKKDKVILTISILPIIIGLILYYFLGDWVFTTVLDKVKNLSITAEYGSTGESVVKFVFGTILSVVFFFVVNYTFVLVVSIIAAPFNDFVSERVEKTLLGKVDAAPFSLGRIFKTFFFTVFNEIKKIIFILGLTTVSIILSFIPVLVPISIILNSFLMSVTFLDYSWSRHNLIFGECIGDLRKSFFGYGVNGFVFIILLSIPIVNLIAYPLGIIHFTRIFTLKRFPEAKSV